MMLRSTRSVQIDRFSIELQEDYCVLTGLLCVFLPRIMTEGVSILPKILQKPAFLSSLCVS